MSFHLKIFLDLCKILDKIKFILRLITGQVIVITTSICQSDDALKFKISMTESEFNNI
jgi:hypothetical protein